MMEAEYLIIGSGPAGVIAAQTLLLRGKKVCLVDAGLPENPNTAPPPGSFRDLQVNDSEQWKYFLGENFDALQVSDIRTGAHLSARRKHLTEGVAPWLHSEGDLNALESLASGGLGQAWGLGSFTYSDEELRACGLPLEEMREAYREVTGRIGISAGKDDLRPHILPGIDDAQPALVPDRLIARLIANYSRKREHYAKKGITLGSPGMALLTQPMNGRPALNYEEMEFYRDDESAWRPHITLREMSSFPGFRYISGIVAMSFHEAEEWITVSFRRRSDAEAFSMRTKRLILATGALSTARIVMRSQGTPTLPLLCNPYYYLVAISPRFLGAGHEKKRSALAQAMMMLNHASVSSRNVFVSLYTYGSLLQYRLLREIPLLPLREALRIARFAAPALLIAGIHHPESPSDGKNLRLIPDGDQLSGDRLMISYKPDPGRNPEIGEMNRRVGKALLRLGAIPLRLVDPGIGASIHYAGTLPFRSDGDSGYLHANGRLDGTNQVYVADSSGFRFLPAKGITLSIMANAHRIAQGIE